MYSEVKINNELTMATFGYNINDLLEGSHQKVVVVCINCNKIIHRERRNIFNKHRCSSVINKNKRCFKCLEWKDLTLFNKNPKGSGGVSKLCRKCYNNNISVKAYEKRRNLRFKKSIEDNDIKFYIKRRFPTKKSHCKRNGIEFNITEDFLYNLWEKQNGKCFYTNLEMNNSLKQKGFQSWDSPSLDRLNPEKGYVQDNVVWCIFAVNSFKQSLTYEDFMNQLSKIIWRNIDNGS